jgi:phytoene/squalene synthetase
MEMDLSETKYSTVKDYNTYIYGSAEVVGLMCLKVFCNGDQAYYNSLKEPAKKLGAAFQKVNFLRDIKSDYTERGRVYFPNVDFVTFDEKTKQLIEDDIQKDFDEALIGIKQLPDSARAGVYLAYVYYLKLFEKIKNSSSVSVKNERIRVADFQKIILLIATYLKLSTRSFSL